MEEQESEGKVNKEQGLRGQRRQGVSARRSQCEGTFITQRELWESGEKLAKRLDGQSGH